MASLANGGRNLTGEVSTPSWDGSAKTWRRYLKEVQWYVLGTKPKLRRYLASRLIMRLSGSARLLAMTWQLSEFDNEAGVTTMLQKLSKSPLVRKTLPNAASIMAQYFEFRRLQGENISAFLIRENLHFEEFRECLIRLREEQNGVDYALHNFGLPSSEADGLRTPQGEEEDASSEEPHPSPDLSSRRRRYQRVPQHEEEAAEEEPRTDEAVLSMSDSFILEQLRGWRLLTSASLNQEEWRDVLGACQGKLDYSSISEALQVLYDEQMIGSTRSRHSHPGQPQLFSLEDDWGDEDWGDYYDNSWESAYYQGWYDEWEEPWWPDQLRHDGGAGDEARSSMEEACNEKGTTEQEDQDQMALSWSQAHKGVASMKTDRGFGRPTCFICGSAQHFARECPDKFSPYAKGKQKGKHKGYGGGKSVNYMMDEDWYSAMALSSKGKGKMKSKAADMNYVKGKKGFSPWSSQKGKGKVNTYMMTAMNHYGMEFDEVDLQSMERTTESPGPKVVTPGPESAMLDSGATCSAGPETSVRRLIAAILEKDSGATIEVNTKLRPKFRYGSGKWNQALYRVTISSNLSSTRRAFTCFSLPDPEEIQQSWFTPSMLVPVLLGMDFLHQVGAVLDFTDGMCCFSQLGVTVNLPINSKGHFLINIADFLTDGHTCQNHSAHVQLRLMEHEEVHEECEAKTCELEFYTMEGQVSDLKIYQDHTQKRHFVDMVNRRIDLNQQIGLMGNWLSQPSEISTTSSTTSHAEDREDRTGSLPHSGTGPPGSKSIVRDLALSRKTPGGKTGREQVRAVDPLLKMRTEAEVCAKEGGTRKSVSFRESRDGEASTTRTMARTSWRVGSKPRVGQGDDREGDRRGKDVGDVGRLPTHVGQEQEEGGAGKGSSWKHTNQGISEQVEGERSPIDTNLVDRCGTCVSRGGGPAAVFDPRRKGSSAATGTQASSNKCDQRCGVGAKLPLKDPAEDIKKKMPLEVGRGINNLIDYMDKDFNGELAKVIYDGGTTIWEMFCSPESGLTTEVRSQGLDGVRINIAGGYDLYKEAYYPHLRELRRKQRPRKYWLSTPCTPYCDWSELNYFYRWEVLEKKRRKEKGMHKKVMGFLLESLDEDPLSELYWEWPMRCRGWKTTHMLEFQEQLRALGREVYFCRIDGCRFGMKSSGGNYVKKSWTIMTTDIAFYNEFRLRACLGNHEHEWLHGTETTRSAYYPVNMCRSIARLWRRQLLPDRWRTMLWTAPTVLDPFAELFTDKKEEYELHAAEDLHSELPQQEEAEAEPTRQEREKWEARLHRFHRAAGHPTSRNMARVMSDAQLPRWKVKAAFDFKCPACQEAKLGSIGSKEIGPTSTRELPNPFEHVGMDIAEWEVPGGLVKLKFLLLMDMATKYKVTETMFTCSHGQIKVESADDLIRVFTLRWLMHLPRPHTIIPDNAKSFTAKKFVEAMSDLSISVCFPPDKESWAHGRVERGIQVVKETANRIQLSNPGQDPTLTLALATAAVNATEYTKGFSSIQWVFGKQTELSDEELRQQLSLPVDRLEEPFLKLMNQRRHAEDCARKARAGVIISKIANTTIKQPLRTFNLAEPVMIWRKFLPHSTHRGSRGGHKRTVKPRWVGPGRVVLHELIPGQGEEDRKGIVWVVMGNNLYRCSVHSVRPLSDRERAVQEVSAGEPTSKWKQLADLIPSREYTDLEHEQPEEDEKEEPELILPDEAPQVQVRRSDQPAVRFYQKDKMDNRGLPQQGISSMIPPAVNEYEKPDKGNGEEMAEDTGTSLPTRRSRRSSTTSSSPLIPDDDQEELRGEEEEAKETREGADYSPSIAPQPSPIDLDEEPTEVMEPESKRQRVVDLDSEEGLTLHHQTIFEEIEECYVMNIEIEIESKRQRKALIQNPQAFLVKKMAGAEVCYRKLSNEDKRLFNNAKDSEVSSFLRTAAVRRCLDEEELREAKHSGRILKSRWVLVWKSVPDESREEALDDARSNTKTTHRKDGTKKAKARIVVLGYQHPDLLDPETSTTAPVQSQIMRHLSFQVVAQRKWTLEGLDMATAFLQTGRSEENRKVWMEAVPELKRALQAEDHEVLRILKNVYGNATAPRGLWKDVDETFQKLGSKRMLGDNSFWTWTKPNPHPRNEADKYILIGFVGGHVDDFNRAGDLQDPEWLRIRAEIDKSYKWGTTKVNQYRHTGLDLQVRQEGGEYYVEMDQTFYTDALQDLGINAERLRMDENSKLTPSEISLCRAGLGGLQWVATQTQLQICARVNLLLSQLTVEGTVGVAKEIQEVIVEVRKNAVKLRFWHIPSIQHWQDATVVTLADQAHANRPRGDSTGGLITFIGGPELLQGLPGRMSIVGWRTWKLKRKAISTNDGEIQAMLEGEDNNFRTRLLWCELNGCSGLPRVDLLDRANVLVKHIQGINGTDSKGGYDAVKRNEGPLLGLTNARSALPAYQLREQLEQGCGRLIWLSGDWNLSDALTKKSKEARMGLLQFLRNFTWQLYFDPNFVVSEKKAKKSGQTALKQMRELQALVPYKW